MKIYKGVAGTAGIVKGEIYYFEKRANTKYSISFDEALEQVKQKNNLLYEKTVNSLDKKDAQIFEAYNMILEDKTFVSPIVDSINSGFKPEDAIINHVEKMVNIFENHKSEYMRERADDIKYIGKLLLDSLKGIEYNYELPDDKKVILVAEELSPTDTVQFDKDKISGFAIEKGGATSHTVILAKSMGIPAVVGISDVNKRIDGKECILDAENSLIIVEPDEEKCIEYDKIIKEQSELKDKIDKLSEDKAITKDNTRIYLYGNIGNEDDVESDNLNNIDGIGLFRTEFLYTVSQQKPSFEKQVSSYKTIIDKISPNDVTVRVIDIGGDKQISYMNIPEEENPFLGCRGIRLCILNQAIFREQIEAILIASKDKRIKILLPMITTLDELEYAKKTIYEICKKLNIKNNTSIGIMIETPASAINADMFAKHCDFFSIGTNDLTQYITASDRGNENVSNLYTPLHPAVLKLIKYVIECAEKNHIDISMCGDMASDFNLTALLLGLGLRKFSVPLPLINKMKYNMSKIDLSSTKQLATEILSAERIKDIEDIIAAYNKKYEISL